MLWLPRLVVTAASLWLPHSSSPSPQPLSTHREEVMAMRGPFRPAVLLPGTYDGLKVPGSVWMEEICLQADGMMVPDPAHYFAVSVRPSKGDLRYWAATALGVTEAGGHPLVDGQMALGGWFASRSARILSALINMHRFRLASSGVC